MNYELTVQIAQKSHKVFLQDGFHTKSDFRTPLHKHSYAEVHLVATDTAEFQIGDQIFSSEKGNLILIPAGTFHRLNHNESCDCHIAFQVDCDINALLSTHVLPQIIFDFAKEIERSKKTGDYAVVAAYIPLFISRLTSEHVQIQPVLSDYRFLICEFFSRRYAEDLQLSDLAKELHLSERQTARLVVQHTGNTFRNELTARRLSVADHLLQTTSMSKAEIARYVGYRSYVGFWKALKATQKDH